MDPKGSLTRHTGERQASPGSDYLEMLLTHLPGMVYRCRNYPDWPVEYVSAGSEALCGYSPADIMQNKPGWGNIIAPEDREGVWKSVQAAVQEKVPFALEYRIVTRSGAAKWVWERGRAVEEDKAGVVLEGFITDISPFKDQQLALEKSRDEAQAAETALRESEDRFRSLVRTAPCVIITLAPTGEVNEWNGAAEELIGYPRDDILGRNYVDLCVPQAWRASVRQDIRNVLAGYDTYGFENPIITAGGEQCTLLWNVRRQLDAQDQPIGVLAIGHDITQLKRSESALARSEAYFKTIINTAADGIITIDSQGHIESFNRAAQSLLGYSEREISGKNIKLLMPEPYSSEHDHYIERYLHSGEARIIGSGREVTARRKDGSLVPIHLSVSEISLDGDRCFAGIIRDLSAQRAAAEALRAEHERLNAVIEHAPLGIITYRLGQPFVSANTPFCEMTGYTSEELKAMTVEDLTHPEERAASAKLAARARAGEIDRFSQRKRYLCKDGSVVEVQVVNAVTHDAAGRPDMVIGEVEDLTPQLRAEAEVREIRDRLAHAERLYTLGEMAAGIAHEINQPLSAISLFAQAARRFYDTGNLERMREIFDKLSQHAQRAGDVIERMQALARRRESSREIVDCNAIVMQTVELAESEARIRDIQIVFEPGSDLPPINVDVVQIQQVALNLLRNGMEAMQSIKCRNGRVIRVRSRCRDEGGVQVAVIDSGCGISEEVAKTLFSPFSTTKASGMGVGLSISRDIVNSHDGQLEFHNNQAGGATFIFTLPAFTNGDQDEQ